MFRVSRSQRHDLVNSLKVLYLYSLQLVIDRFLKCEILFGKLSFGNYCKVVQLFFFGRDRILDSK